LLNASPMLRREVPVRSPTAARIFVAWLVVFGLIAAAMTTRPRVMKIFSESKVDLTRMAVMDYADSAFMMWRHNHRHQPCPSTLGELNEYTNRKLKNGRPDISDAWGYDMRMSCDERGIRVWSLGEDGRYGTSDDVRSWD
jgi:hypothetical protein